MTLEQIEKNILYWESMRELLLEEIPVDATLDTIIYKKYLELESVKKVAEWLNDSGYRKESSSTQNKIKYESNDITARIKDKNAQVPEKLKENVKKLFIDHKTHINKRYN